MSPAPQAFEPVLVPPKHAPSFSTVLIYEEIEAAKRGEWLYRALVDTMEGDGRFTLDLWNFNVLRIPEIRNLAATAAATADTVILSMSGRKRLSAKVKEWIEMWVWLIDSASPAVIALFEGPGKERDPILAHLRRVTACEGLEIFDYTMREKPRALRAGAGDRKRMITARRTAQAALQPAAERG